MAKTDSEIKKEVLRELAWDTRVEEAEIGVAVTGGVVTLTGTVSSWGKKVAAAEAAHRVTGVCDVANDLAVRVGETGDRTDSDIARAVRHALEWDVFVPDNHIRSTVSDGWVTLEGDVDFWSHREDADKAVRNLAGVRGVTNRIEVRPPKASAADVRKALEQALARHAEREAARIALEVQDGRIALTGVVHSWAEREAVVGAARGTAGVRAVEDRLRIEPYAL